MNMSKMSTVEAVELTGRAHDFEKATVGAPVVLEDPLAGTGKSGKTPVRVYGKNQVLEVCDFITNEFYGLIRGNSDISGLSLCLLFARHFNVLGSPLNRGLGLASITVALWRWYMDFLFVLLEQRL